MQVKKLLFEYPYTKTHPTISLCRNRGCVVLFRRFNAVHLVFNGVIIDVLIEL